MKNEILLTTFTATPQSHISSKFVQYFQM